VLERHDLTADRLRSTLVPGTTFGESAVPFTPGAKRVLERALHEALALNHPDIEPEHLLLALTGDIPDDAPAAGAGALLRAAEVDAAVLHTELLGLLPKGAGRARRFSRRERGERLEPALVPVRGSAIGVRLPTSGPLCGHCRTPLEVGLRYAIVDAQPAEAEEAGPRRVVVVYCGSCGATLPTLSS
jgi:Clp amino terminal domain, pathogenicity island component